MIHDGNLTTSIVTVNGVDTSAAGTYTVTYNVSDDGHDCIHRFRYSIGLRPQPLVIRRLQ